MGGLLIAVVSATALVPASTQALTWTVVPSPNVKPHANYNILYTPSCISPTDCTAVGIQGGNTKHGNNETAEIQSWNGTTWSMAPTPKAVNRALYGVSCVSARACTAVGVNFVGNGANRITTPLVESWNGTTWSVVPMIPQLGAELMAVSCVSVTACTAVGDQVDGSTGADVSLIESWNGTRWSVVPSPNAAAKLDLLDAVSCVSATFCAAVGESGLKNSFTLMEMWNGKRWSLAPSPTPGHEHSDFVNGVWCTSATFCAAVGEYFVPQGPASEMPFVESWNGTRWSVTALPHAQGEFDGVSCASATDCRAAGTQWKSASGNRRTLMAAWNGTTWSIEPVPNASGAEDALDGVSCSSAAFCAAVGSRGPGGPETLTEIGTPHG
jgi:hypothetical protein